MIPSMPAGCPGQNAGPNPTVPAVADLNVIQPPPKHTKTQTHMSLLQIYPSRSLPRLQK